MLSITWGFRAHIAARAALEEAQHCCCNPWRACTCWIAACRRAGAGAQRHRYWRRLHACDGPDLGHREGDRRFQHADGGGKYRTIKVAGLAGVPDDGSVGAVSLNATVGTAPGYGTLFGRPDADTSRTSMLIYNGNTGEYVSNTATVAVGADGTIQIMAETSARVILDVQGYYTANTDGTAAGGFVPVAGKRFVDTRSGLGAPKATIAPGKSVDVQVTGANGVPAGASGAVVNLIAINIHELRRQPHPIRHGQHEAAELAALHTVRDDVDSGAGGIVG
ncbi:hypothetical protein QP157_03500 [Sphingomonas sp. LR61]|uniref:hypothetical protein n=1 Tax=Sphingomonas sp. LR61 TaxID=3050234 RepID=UPI002FE003AA